MSAGGRKRKLSIERCQTRDRKLRAITHIPFPGGTRTQRFLLRFCSDPYPASVQPYDLAANTQSQTDTAALFGTGFVNPVKTVEDLLQIPFRNTDSRIRYFRNDELTLSFLTLMSILPSETLCKRCHWMAWDQPIHVSLG